MSSFQCGQNLNNSVLASILIAFPCSILIVFNVEWPLSISYLFQLLQDIRSQHHSLNIFLQLDSTLMLMLESLRCFCKKESLGILRSTFGDSGSQKNPVSWTYTNHGTPGMLRKLSVSVVDAMVLSMLFSDLYALFVSK